MKKYLDVDKRKQKSTFYQKLLHYKYIKLTPKVFPRILKGILKRCLLKQKVLRTMELAITYNCNFNCPYCSAKYLGRDFQYMSLSEIKKFWPGIIDLGLIHVDLTGGEPTMVPDKELCEIINYLSWNNSVMVTIATNGFRINRERLEKYKKAGLNGLMFHLQSSVREEHDKMVRVPGSYDRVIQGIKDAKDLGLNVCINTMFGKNDFGKAELLNDFCNKHNIFLLVNPLAAAGGMCDKKGDKVTEMYEKYTKLIKKPHIRVDTMFNFRGSSGCPGGIEKWYVTSYGEVMQCPFIQVSYGNVLKEDVKDIYKRICNFPYLAEDDYKCKHLFNHTFQEEIIEPTLPMKKLPISIFKHPVLKKNPELLERLK